ncbi:MAG: hypothetical protein JOZ17_17655 [Acetobacteraceae bacterium]|nr:hypothetical protein [Acetobacteraceae bacterium]
MTRLTGGRAAQDREDPVSPHHAAAAGSWRGRAARCRVRLQEDVWAKPDGQLGAATLAAVLATIAKAGLDALCAEFMTERLTFMAALPGWQHDGRGWARRLCRLPYQGRSMEA